MSLYQIKSRFDDRTLYECEAESMLKALQEAVNKGADLQCANLQGADLRGADLRGADLQCAYLQGAYLQGAYLRGADFRGADLRGADLRGADLRGAGLRGAGLRGADLRGADLRGADLRGADLQGANLQGADLQGAKINWNSHHLIAEILFRAAGEDVEKRCLAGGIALSTDWCWEKMMSISHPQKNWAISVFLKYIQDGDNAPKILRDLKDSSAKTAGEMERNESASKDTLACA